MAQTSTVQEQRSFRAQGRRRGLKVVKLCSYSLLP